MIEFDESMTLGEARAWLEERVVKGARCPCCTQLVKLYRRKLNSMLARNLTVMYKASGTEWVNTVDLFKAAKGARHSVGDLHYWGLVEQGESRNSVWRVTVKGARFVRGEITVEQYAEIFLGELQRLSGDQITIRQAFDSPFDYDDLMHGV